MKRRQWLSGHGHLLLSVVSFVARNPSAQHRGPRPPCSQLGVYLRMPYDNRSACTIYNAIIIFENTIAVYQMWGLIQILKSDGIHAE